MKTLSLHEAAALVQLHPETLRSWAKEGRAPGAKLGKSWLFIDTDLLDWVRSNYAQPPPPPPPRPPPLTKAQIDAMMRRHKVGAGSAADELNAMLTLGIKQETAWRRQFYGRPARTPEEAELMKNPPPPKWKCRK